MPEIEQAREYVVSYLWDVPHDNLVLESRFDIQTNFYSWESGIRTGFIHMKNNGYSIKEHYGRFLVPTLNVLL